MTSGEANWTAGGTHQHHVPLRNLSGKGCTPYPTPPWDETDLIRRIGALGAYLAIPSLDQPNGVDQGMNPQSYLCVKQIHCNSKSNCSLVKHKLLNPWANYNPVYYLFRAYHGVLLCICIVSIAV